MNTRWIIVCVCSIISLFATRFFISPAQAQSLEQIQYGGGANCGGVNTQVVQGCQYSGNPARRTFVLTVADRSNIGVRSVDGYGLSWSRYRAACSGRNQQGMETWIAQGIGQSGVLNIGFSSQARAASAYVGWYDGVDETNPVVQADVSNTNGQGNNVCANGKDSAQTILSIAASEPSCLLLIGTDTRGRTIRTGPTGFTQRASVFTGTSGNATRLYVHDRIASVGSYDGGSRLSGSEDWVESLLVLRPKQSMTSPTPTGVTVPSITLTPTPTTSIPSPTPTGIVTTPTPTTVIVSPSPKSRVFHQTRSLLQNGSVSDATSWNAFQSGYTFDATEGRQAKGSLHLHVTSSSQQSGAYQRVDLQQSSLLPVTLTGYVKGNGINKTGWFGASLYAEIYLTNGNIVYWNSAPNAGTFDWRYVGFNISSLSSVNAPIDHIFIVPILGDSSSGDAWFDDLSLVEYQSDGSAVTFVIDDGDATTLDAATIMATKGFVGSAPIPTSLVGTDGYMTMDQIHALAASGWEIMSHGITHTDMTQMSSSTLSQELSTPKQFYQAQGIQVKNIAYPFGAYNGEVVAATQQYYRSGRAYEIGANGGGNWPYDVKVRSLEQSTTLATAQSWVNDAMANHQWLVMVGHHIATSGDDQYYMTPQVFTSIVQYVNDTHVPVVTYDQGLDMFSL